MSAARAPRKIDAAERARSREPSPSDSDDETSEQHGLFPGLQSRYPRRRKNDEEPSYVRLEFMSAEDGRFNVRRLRKEAAGRLAHADKLEAYLLERQDDAA